MGEYQHIEHDFDPVFDENSEILILGTLPSVKSREQGFYYGHPQNRFWRVVSAVTGEPLPESVEEKKAMLLRNGIAVWDVIQSCDIIGSSDSTIKNAEAADVVSLLGRTNIKAIYANGALAKRLYDRFLAMETGIEAVKLPSTSPANAGFRLDDLIRAWQIIKR